MNSTLIEQQDQTINPDKLGIFGDYFSQVKSWKHAQQIRYNQNQRCISSGTVLHCLQPGIYW